MDGCPCGHHMNGGVSSSIPLFISSGSPYPQDTLWVTLRLSREAALNGYKALCILLHTFSEAPQKYICHETVLVIQCFD